MNLLEKAMKKLTEAKEIEVNTDDMITDIDNVDVVDEEANVNLNKDEKKKSCEAKEIEVDPDDMIADPEDVEVVEEDCNKSKGTYLEVLVSDLENCANCKDCNDEEDEDQIDESVENHGNKEVELNDDDPALKKPYESETVRDIAKDLKAIKTEAVGDEKDLYNFTKGLLDSGAIDDPEYYNSLDDKGKDELVKNYMKDKDVLADYKSVNEIDEGCGKKKEEDYIQSCLDAGEKRLGRELTDNEKEVIEAFAKLDEADSDSNSKVQNLKLMNDAARHINDEEVIDIWLTYGVPDGATEEDFEDIANDPEEYDRIEKEFKNVMKDAVKDGLFQCPEETLKFARKYEPDIKNTKIERDENDNIKFIKEKRLQETGEWNDNDEDLVYWEDDMRNQAEELASQVNGTVKSVNGFDAYQGPFAIVNTPNYGDVELWYDTEDDRGLSFVCKVAHVGYISGGINDIANLLNKDEIPKDQIIENKNIIKEEEYSFDEIITRMENATDYSELYDAALLIKNDDLRTDVEHAIETCEQDGDDVETAYSIVTSDLLDDKVQDLNENLKINKPSFNVMLTKFIKENYKNAKNLRVNKITKVKEGYNIDATLKMKNEKMVPVTFLAKGIIKEGKTSILKVYENKVFKNINKDKNMMTMIVSNNKGLKLEKLKYNFNTMLTENKKANVYGIIK